MKRFLLFIGISVAACCSPIAAYAITPDTPCGGLWGCGDVNKNYVLQFLAHPYGLIALMLQIIAGLAVLFIVWSGFRMATSFGDEGKIGQFKWGVANSLIGLTVAILSEAAVAIVGSQALGGGPLGYGGLPCGTPLTPCPTGGSNLALPQNTIAAFILILRIAFNAVFVVMAVVAGLRMMYAQGKADDFNKGKTMLYWSIAGAVIVNLAVLLADAVANYFKV